MVVQQAPQAAVVWGTCSGDCKVTVKLSSSTASDTATVDATAGQAPGTWIAKLPATAGGTTAYVVTASDGTNTAALNDVLFGDVWVCSG